MSTESLTMLLRSFNQMQFPVDVFWLDIEYTQDKKYFVMDPERLQNIHEYVQEVEHYDKRLTIITDPHIKVDNEYFVYKEGK